MSDILTAGPDPTRNGTQVFVKIGWAVFFVAMETEHEMMRDGYFSILRDFMFQLLVEIST